MADIQIETGGWAGAEGFVVQNNVVWRSPTIGYMFLSNATIDLAYKKTTDGGETWGTAVDIYVGTVISVTIWDKEWTTGTSSDTIIHIAFIDNGSHDVLYNSLDTSDDSFTYAINSAEKTIFNGASSSTGGMGNRSLSIVRAQSGRLGCGGRIDPDGENFFATSDDDGATWTSRAALMDGNTDMALLTPGNTAAGDTDDMWAIYYDLTADEISLKVYDASANSWSETAIGSVSATADMESGFGAAHRISDGHTIVTFWSEKDTATADIKVFDITSASTITAKTDVISNTSEAVQCPVFINQQNDDIYVAYAKGGTWGATVDIFYKKSTDGGGTWGTETAYSVDTADDHRLVLIGNSIGDNGGRFYPSWWNDDNSDIMGNFTNSVSIAAAAAGGATIPVFIHSYRQRRVPA